MEAAATPVRLEPPAVRAEPRETDGDLLQRIADSDSAAFESLYHRYARPLLGLALRMLRDRSRAEDAVQETFASIWRSAPSYRPERGPGAPWLYAVARNAIVDRARARGEQPSPSRPTRSRPAPGPAEQTEASYVSWRVHRAVDELPPREREALELAYWSGLSQSEIAQFLDIPLGTVKTRTRSGLARLADLLEGKSSGEPPTSTTSSAPTWTRRTASACAHAHDLLVAAGPPPRAFPCARADAGDRGGGRGRAVLQPPPPRGDRSAGGGDRAGRLRRRLPHGPRARPAGFGAERSSDGGRRRQRRPARARP